MATIVIRDLPESVDLDREAMRTITGGARLRGQPGAARALARSRRFGVDAIAERIESLPPREKPRRVTSTLFQQD